MYCAIMFVGCGSTHHYGKTPVQAARLAVKQAKRDWRGLYTFPKGKMLKVRVYESTNSNGWYADDTGVFDQDTDEKLHLVELIEVRA